METWCNWLLRQYMESGGNGWPDLVATPMDGGAFYATREPLSSLPATRGTSEAAGAMRAGVVMGIDPTCWAAFESRW